MGGLDLIGAARGALGAFTSLLRTLVRLHLDLAKAEAEVEARRLQGALLLLFFSALTLTGAMMLAQVALVLVARRYGLDWMGAVLLVGGGNLLFGLACLGLASRRLSKAWLPRTRARLAETVASIAEPPR